MKLNKELKALLVLLLKDEVTIQSWGISNIHIEESTISFNVCGLKYCGNVYIYIDEGKYKVVLKDKVFLCSLENILPKLDSEIEKTDNYISDVYSIIQKSSPK